MQKLLEELARLLPDITFQSGKTFHWSPQTTTITYEQAKSYKPKQKWALLHEAAHALLNHRTYKTDLELLLLETAAWHKAQEIAKQLGHEIDNDHIQDCLDTYRDWLHQRSTCPRCSTISLQTSPHQYRCHNCTASWYVSASRFCRPYRLSADKEKPLVLTQPAAFW